jgi:hypothetical protein
VNAATILPLSHIVDELVPETLMVPLSMVVRDKLGQRSSQMALTKRNHPVETFFFDRTHEAFGVGIGVGCLKRRLHDSDPGIVQPLANGRAPLGVPVTDPHAMAHERALIRGRECATHLTHDLSARSSSADADAELLDAVGSITNHRRSPRLATDAVGPTIIISHEHLGG